MCVRARHAKVIGIENREQSENNDNNNDIPLACALARDDFVHYTDTCVCLRSSHRSTQSFAAVAAFFSCILFIPLKHRDNNGKKNVEEIKSPQSI